MPDPSKELSMDSKAAAEIGELVRDILRHEIGALLEEQRRFFDRRIAELSTEIHATTELMDFSEAKLSGQLTRMRDEIHAVVAPPPTVKHNSGVELEAVVQASEDAAHRIMEAAEAIHEWVDNGMRDGAGLATVNEKVVAIYEACSFQDLTSQRVRRAIEKLKQVEDTLNQVVGEPTSAPAAESDTDLRQDEIDRMLR
jgi:chemotaxis protein CheZ